MDSLTSMKSKLEKTGIYKFDGGSNVEKELKAYAIEIDRLFEQLAVLQRECFIDTAQSYGILLRENFLGFDRSYLELDERRKILKACEQMSGSCTVGAFGLMLESYGIENYKFEENPTNNSLKVYVYDEVDEESKALIVSQVKEDFPLHLNVEVVFDSV